MKLLDLTGKRFGRLVVLNKQGHKGRLIAWRCKCDCGNETIVSVSNLLNNSTKSCGCLAREIYSSVNKTHGMTNTPLYKTWKNIKTRCYNPKCQKYKNYGGKGISMCKEWLDDFMSFYKWSNENGYETGLTIDRIDVDGNYEPNNCRWVNWKTQQRNKSNNIYVEFNGKKVCLKEYAELKGISYDKARTEYKKGERNEI